MSTDWIKMRVDLREDPAVFRLSKMTKLDRLSVVGRLWAFWSWADKHAVNGRIDGADTADVDEIADKRGFAQALSEVGWLAIGDGFVAIPKHDRHTGESAKERSLKNARQARWRQSRDAAVDDPPSTSGDGQPSTRPSTREEKRREEKEKPSVSPRATRKCPEGFAVTAEMREWACIDAVGVDVDRETAKFRDYTFKTARSDWLGTWKNWIREAFDRLPKATASVETFQQRAARERVAQMSPRLAAKAPGAQPATEVIDGSTKLIA